MAFETASQTSSPPAPRRWRGFVLVALILIAVSAAIDAKTYLGRYNGPPIRSDGFGYYLFLPAIFIHHDIYFTFIDTPERWPDLPDNAMEKNFGTRTEKGYHDKYAIGTAVLQTPFFLAANVVAHARHADPSGFETVYQLANMFSGLVYLLIGSALIYGSALRFVSPAVATLITLAGALATNAVHYGSYDASFSHIYSYALAAAVIALVLRGRQSWSVFWYYAALGTLVGLAVMVRPTNMIMALLLFANIQFRWADIWKAALGFVLFGIISTLPQTVFWWLTTGSPIYYSYRSEGFSFLRPQLLNFLFSVHKGLYFWHPIYLALIALTAVAALRKNLVAALILLVVCAAYYVNSCWNAWFFGGSFGSRTAIDTLPLLCTGTAIALRNWRPSRNGFIAASAAVAVLVAINMTMLNGYIVQTIPFDNATWDIYQAFWADPFRDRG